MRGLRGRRRADGTALRVCHVSTAHSADDARVFWRECVGLASRGFDVTLVARAPESRRLHGVTVVALPTYRHRLVRMTVGVGRAFTAVMRSRAVVVHLHDPELIPLIVVMRLLGKRVIYDAHEWLSRQVTAKHYLPPLAQHLAGVVARGLERFVGRMADRVVTVNEACAAAYPAGRVSVVANYPDLNSFNRTAPDPGATEPSRVTCFVYVGGISAARGLPEMVDALTLLNGADQDGADQDGADAVGLRLVGGFSPPELAQQMADRPGWSFVDVVGRVAHRDVPSVVGDAVAGLATLLPTPNHLISSPVKVFEYMAMGLPVIVSDFPRWREMLAGVDCAYFVDPEDPRAIADAMREVIDHPEQAALKGQRGRGAVESTFNWDRQLATLVDAYAQVLRRGPGQPAW